MMVIETGAQVQDQSACQALVTRFDRSQRHMHPDRSETRVETRKKRVGQDRAGQHKAERAWISELVWVWVWVIE